MTFEEALAQVWELLEHKGRVSYRTLKLQFNLDDDYLEGLKDELIEAEHVAADEGGKVLVWVGAAPVPSSQPLTPNPQPPSSYTPPHLAERIRAASSDGRRAQDDHRPVCRSQRLDGVD